MLLTSSLLRVVILVGAIPAVMPVNPQPVPPVQVGEAALTEKAWKAMGGTEGIVFVERDLYQDGHYCPNLGGDSVDTNNRYRAPDNFRLANHPP